MTISFAPARLCGFLLLTHSLRCGLHSSAALRLNALPVLRGVLSSVKLSKSGHYPVDNA